MPLPGYMAVAIVLASAARIINQVGREKGVPQVPEFFTLDWHPKGG